MACALFDTTVRSPGIAMMSDTKIAAEMLAQVTARAPATICPSEVARALSDDWRVLMPRVRAVAKDLTEVEATQGGAKVDPVTARGTIRLRLIV
ncbi:hypothetical protein JDO7802_01876 [Jannaschia donghaensis]|uniref:DUF3253 domain-containing protein n=2 Tax=Jannaschia donghaensis TaxID=420998 RepID=A0A0M6YJ89_9RHOB|nr:hypothetical protein JDO7802_01876 [Jannaschia donghaensis]